MALGNSNNAIFLGISNGKISRQFQTPTEKSISRVNKNGKTVHEEFYDFVEGKITDITTKDSDYGKFWCVTLQDDGDKYVLQFNYSSGYANGFLKTLPNVDMSSIVKLVPKATQEGDKTKTTLFINQNNEGLKWHYTKDAPNGLPPMVKVKVKGKETWDDSDAMEFLEAMARERVLEIVQAKYAPAVNTQEDEDAPF
jgi:hypothetical protein